MGSGMYKINMMFMRRPKGDEMDSNVEFFIDVAPNQILVTVQQRSVVLDDNHAITMEDQHLKYLVWATFMFLHPYFHLFQWEEMGLLCQDLDNTQP
ncbi:hypothetical protein CTAM01_06422 [Colletotrichum tamarilloi]|uniref:Uncharacterized protein n=1 Tax=Colletotrichum tamarilloi TaxID=1209934 RepID=A0ABQ9RBF8_9PEZI|nr:uncharacterized protein CTAM01_06422 [Colletotrichum tamarilloi]KAK1500487.1 hypothetical protein CTAM01_06422 [Colletotrichum tamarilloi]